MNSPIPSTRKILAMAGLEDISSPHELFQHIAFNCTGHDDFRNLMAKTPPEQRRRAYDTLVPHLRFKAKALDVYMSEAGSIAEVLQLPTVGVDGALLPFRAVNIESPEYIAEQAWKREHGKFHLTLKCRRCTTEGQFHGMRKADAIQDSRNVGWGFDETGGGRDICPKCLVN